MAKKRTDIQDPATIKSDEAATGTEFPQQEGSPNVDRTGPARTKRSLTLPLKEDGTVDWDSMRDTTASKLRAAIGAADMPAQVSGLTVNKETVEALFDGLGSLEEWIAVRFFGIDGDIAHAVVPYSPAQKEQIVPPASKLINKYSKGALKWQDEATFAFIMYNMLSAKIQQCAFLMEQRIQGRIKQEQEDAAKRGLRVTSPIEVPVNESIEGVSKNEN